MQNNVIDFTLKNHLGEEITLSNFKGKKIWLAFYRYASCPLCNLHIHNIIKNYHLVEEAGLVFLPVFQSTAQEISKYVGKNDVPFNILCDPDEKTYKQYQVNHSYKGFLSLSVYKKIAKAMLHGFLPGQINGEMGRIPSELIIDENFVISFRYDGKDIGDHPDLELILNKSRKH